MEDGAKQKTAQLKSAKKELADLKIQNTNLAESLKTTVQALKDAGKHSKTEENKAVRKEVKKWIKDFGFRNTKFVKGERLKQFMERIYANVKTDLGLDINPDDDHYLPLNEFIRIYESYVQACLGDRRQYVQTQLFDAARSKFTEPREMFIRSYI